MLDNSACTTIDATRMLHNYPLSPDDLKLALSLQELCIHEVIKCYNDKTLEHVPQSQQRRLIQGLPLDMPLELAGSTVADEAYWKRRSEARWPLCSAAQHGGSFKQLFFERNLSDTIEQLHVDTGDIDALKRLLAFSSQFVQGLHLEQLPSHPELDILFDNLGNSLNTLTLHYGMRNVGMNYDRSVFGMKLSDCRSLAQCLECCETLIMLNLSGNCLDDDKLRMLASGLINNQSVIHVDLSDNNIADRGVRAFAKLLHATSVLQIVNLANNQIHSEGGRALARALRTNVSLRFLNLRLNRLCEDGGRAVFDALCQHPFLEHLDVGHNALGQATAASIARCLSQNSAMRELDLAGNELTEGGGREIRSALSSNSSVEQCQLSISGVSVTDAIAIQENLQTRREVQAKRYYSKQRL